ncbi:MAG TPA: F0F1 ATP synthase subunit delta [Candidatus Saccharimonadales bacterium]|nr:F0F1 ATP synthase subunit delta [Candidatus Saccharimonadales bacterium]
MKIARRRLARELVRLIREDPNRRAALLRQTAGYLIATKQAAQAHLLIKDIAHELQADGHVVAEVESAFGLSDQSRAYVKKVLQKSGAHTIELNERVTPHLLGGLVIRTATAELDASVRRQLNQISQQGA